MDLTNLVQQIDSLESEPPFELWDPPNCGDIDMVIKSDGTWWYMGTPINRVKLVKLFANVLVKESSKFFLKTPAEKVGIKVEEAPFVIIDWQTIPTDVGDAIEVTSNLGHRAILSKQHPITVNTSNPEQPKLYVELHRGLTAKVHRNVYYQWVNIGQEKVIDGETHIGIASAEQFFSLGISD
ncbi:hypothetical protein GCM10008107_28530 [Psychrosphaera saromensis]|uniref:Proteophosphoglycan n=1 Tax=Psychrosphaera saromensis TaxID=716813 RepID=A0A2S7UTD0_9GAMM|nr:DUF1285 domain-containing protein [Psychrosphaera saromensis]PQJ52999.1 hypothetical protein BTO11_04560 [Psychrosphaera saromensis]GHB77339.1 hypothetical protein GCM10008107_28530 [Psychrosphaera saromensis]GLQ12838.1 hypothetical protein GCM10007917_02930 [Psychrosphaera saromensis]